MVVRNLAAGVAVATELMMRGMKSVLMRRKAACGRVGLVWWGAVWLLTGVWTAPALGPAQVVLPEGRGPRLMLVPEPGRETEVETLHQQLRVRVVHTLPAFGGWQIVELPRDGDPDAALAQYRRSGAVRWVEADAPIRAAHVLPNDPFFQNGAQWHLNNYGQNGGVPDADLDGPEGWDVIREGTDVIVAILDSGVRWTHEDLRDNLWRDPRTGSNGLNLVTGTNNPWDDNGHGTHVAGLIGAVGNNQRGVCGVAWRVRLMAVKVLDAAGNGYFSDAVIGAEYALTNGARILNISWTSSTNSLAFSNVLWQAGQQGAVVVAAAGNNGLNLDTFPAWPASLRLPHQLTVAASTRSDTVYGQSAYGPLSVHLYAPGAALYSTSHTSDTSYTTMNGTSMAAAVVSGAVALAMARFPEAGPVEIVNRILAAVDVRPAFQGRCRTGGRLNLRKVVDLPRLAVEAGWPPVLRLQGQPGHAYDVWGSPDLVQWEWLIQATPTSEGWSWQDPEAGQRPIRFYRAVPAP